MNEQDMMWQKTLRFRRQSIATVALEVSSKYVAALFKLPRERPAPVPSEGGPKYYWGIPKVDSNLSPLPKVDSSVLTQIVIVVLRSKIDSNDGPRN